MLTHRGFMLDTGRLFFPFQSIYQLIDWLAEAGFNTFHWHISDAESFPLEWRDRHIPLGEDRLAFRDEQSRPLQYSRNDSEMLSYHAAQRGIEIIPEIDLPAHCDCLGRVVSHIFSGPVNPMSPERELNLSMPESWAFAGRLLMDLMLEWFPDSKHIHFGGDEVVGHWPDQDAHSTQLRFHQEFQLSLARACGRTPILWSDPITDKNLPLSQDFIIQCWQNEATLANVLDRGYRAIASPSATWYVGNASPEGLRKACLPDHPNLLGAELVWFTSPADNPDDIEWIRPLIAAAGERMAR